MKINLYDFFRYFDEKNPKHRAAAEDFQRLLNEKAPELLEDTSNWVRIYRSQIEQPKVNGTILNVPWYPQTDNFTLPDSTCNSSACAMCLEFLKPGSLPPGPKGDDAYLRKVLSLGKSTDHVVQTKALESYGVKSTFKYDANFDDLDRELAAGRPVVLGILHRGPESAPIGSGHMLPVIGKTSNGDYVVRDPYGNLYENYVTPVENGRQVIYKKSTLEKRWTVDGPNTGWCRIFEPIKKSEAQTSEITNSLITKKQLSYIWNCDEKLIKDYEVDELNKCLKKFDITTKPRIRHFIAQCSHESGGGRWMKELDSGAAYEGRTDLGNTQKGDGPKYKGAGFIQVTGRYNYQKFADFIGDQKVMDGVDYVSKNYPFTVSGYWWMQNKMNSLCDSGATCRQISARVNGRDPANGLSEREMYYKRCCDVI
jgi:predicted chitinase